MTTFKGDYMSGKGMNRSYVHIYNTARYFAENPRTHHESLAARAFSCFLLEGYLKYIHLNLLPLWDVSKEKELSLVQKLELAHRKLGVCFEAHSQRTQILRELITDRNNIAHPSPTPTSFRAESFACSDAERLKDIFIVPADMEPEEAWESGAGYFIHRDKASSKHISTYYPSESSAKKAFERVVQTIKALDEAVYRSPGIVQPMGYGGPFSSMDSIALRAE
jgi:hypothetical protein